MARARYGVTAPSSSGCATTTRISTLKRWSAPRTGVGPCAKIEGETVNIRSRNAFNFAQFIRLPRCSLEEALQCSARTSNREHGPWYYRPAIDSYIDIRNGNRYNYRMRVKW